MMLAEETANTLSQQVASLLRREITCIRELLVLLEREQAALHARDIPTTEATAAEKNRLAAELEQCGHAREDLLRGEDAWSQLSGKADMATLWDEHQTLLQTARQRNRINGNIIDASQRYTQRAVDVLLNRRPADALYGAAGSIEPLSSTRYTSSA